jgi:putative transposase
MMLINKAFKYRIYPNREQQRRLAVQFGHARFVYNWGLTLRKTHYRQTGQGLSYFECNVRLTELKSQSEYAWLKQADSQVLQQKLKDLDRAYINFFEQRADYPTFKSKRSKQSIRYPQRFKIEGDRIYLPKVGWVKAVFHRPIEGEMKNVTVSRTKSGKYFVSIQWCDPFALNRHKPGDGRRRSRVGSVGNGHQATLIFDNCVSTSVR